MVTLEQARAIQQLVDKGLRQYGFGECDRGSPPDGLVCVEQAVSFVLTGDPLDDHPECVHWVVSGFKRIMNDAYVWRNKEARAAGLRRIAVAQLGSTGINGVAFVANVAEAVGIRVDPVDYGNLAHTAIRMGKHREAIEAAIAELRRQGVEGVTLLDQLEAEHGNAGTGTTDTGSL